MCGIIAVLPVKTEKDKIPGRAREAAMRYLASEMLVASRTRGKDASGIASVYQDGAWSVLKQPVEADDFSENIGQEKYKDQADDANFREYMLRCRSNSSAEENGHTTAILGHVRKGTGGSRYKPANNHPIIVGNAPDDVIIGVHNGGIENDDRIFDLHPEPKRIGSVDSEAIFHLHNCLLPDDAPNHTLLKALDDRLYGKYATLAVNTKHPHIVAGIRRVRPLEIMLAEPLGLILIASERNVMARAIQLYNRMVLSLTGAMFPRITGVTSRSPRDQSSLILDLTKGSSLEECLSIKDLPFTEKDKKEEYKKGAGTKTTHTTVGTNNSTNPYAADQHHNRAAPYTPPKYVAPDHMKSKIKDLTTYEATQPRRTAETTAVLVDDDESGEDVKRVNVPAGAVMFETMLKTEGLGLLETIISNGFDDTLFLKTLNRKNIHKAVDTSGFNSNSETLLKAVTLAYRHAFPEGYFAGYMSAEESNEEPSNVAHLKAKIARLEERHSRGRAFLANMKTLVTALLVAGKFVKVDGSKECRSMALDENLVEFAELVHEDFDPASITSLFKGDKDIDRIADLIQEDEALGADVKPQEESPRKTLVALLST